MPRGRRLTQIDGVLLGGGCHACRMRASKSRAKFAHNCGRQRRTCTLRQFLHGCSGALGISNESMSVPTPMNRAERLAKREALKEWEDYAQVVGVVELPAPPRREFSAPCSDDSDSESEPDEARSELNEAGRQQEAVPEDEGEPPPTEQGDESDEEIDRAAPAPVERPRSLLTGRFGARDTMDPQVLGSRYRVVK